MHFGHIKNIHFVGVGGIGMSGIAEVLSNYDFALSGCDLSRSAITDRLEGRGVRVTIGHDPSHLDGVDLVVISSAVSRTSPEVARARELDLPVIRRAEMLGEMTRLKRAVAVAGTHGKTTTSAMIATVLGEAGLDPTLIVGGVLREFSSNARLGTGDLLVVEADEYDRSFLTLHPTLAVVTNIEADHLDIYEDLDDIRRAFAEFARRVPFFGSVVACCDDERVAEMANGIDRRVVRYGLGDCATLRATRVEDGPDGTRFDVEHHGERLGRVTLNVPGLHSVRNALAAIGVALELDLPFETAAKALERFEGVERRFQVLGECRGAVIVDDYAHHPTEIRTTLEAARSRYPGRRIVALFQPHLYSRTRDFFDGFAEALRVADVAMVAPIYPSREEPIEGVTSALITEAATRRGAANVELLDRDRDGIVAALRERLADGDVLLTLGAGDVNRIGETLAGGGA